MYLVVPEIRINVRTTADIKREIEIAARLRGMSVSSLINSLAVKTIREEKLQDPEAFEKAKRELSAYTSDLELRNVHVDKMTDEKTKRKTG